MIKIALKEQELIQKCIQNKATAQRELVKKYAPVLLALCKRYCVDEHQAKDCLQEGFIRIFKNISNFKGVGSFEGWMKKICVNCCLTQRKKIRFTESIERTVAVNLETEIPDVVSSLNENDLLNIIKSLQEQSYVVFMMHSIEGYSHKEIAETLEISEGTSRSILSRARVKLIEKVNELYLTGSNRILQFNIENN